MQKQFEYAQVGWGFWLKRVLASAVIWAVGWGVGLGVGLAIAVLLGEVGVVFLALGWLVGWVIAVLVQRRLLWRRRDPWSCWWPLVSIVGGFLGFLLGGTIVNLAWVVWDLVVPTTAATTTIASFPLIFPLQVAFEGALGGAITEASAWIFHNPRPKPKTTEAEDQPSPAVTKALE